MRLWFARGTDVSLHEQLVTQVILAVLGNDLSPGQRLPSTRELARRFRLHPNTVSAAYRQLEREGWLERRHGSGVYVRDSRPEVPRSSSIALDHLIANLFRAAHKLGVPDAAVHARLQQWLEFLPPDHFLLIEPNPELRRIVAEEMRQVVTLRVETCGPEDHGFSAALECAVPVVLPSKARAVRELLSPKSELVTLEIRSASSSLAEWLPAPSRALIGVASRWPEFLKLARTMLVAAGFSPDSLVFRDARKPNWHRGLKQTVGVVADSVTATALPKTIRAVRFPLLSETALLELKHWEELLRASLEPTL